MGDGVPRWPRRARTCGAAARRCVDVDRRHAEKPAGAGGLQRLPPGHAARLAGSRDGHEQATVHARAERGGRRRRARQFGRGLRGLRDDIPCINCGRFWPRPASPRSCAYRADYANDPLVATAARRRRRDGVETLTRARFRFCFPSCASAAKPPRTPWPAALLLAHPAMRDPNFRRLCRADVGPQREGAMGVVLNRPMGKRLGELSGDFALGPLAQCGAFHRRTGAKRAAGARRVADTSGWFPDAFRDRSRTGRLHAARRGRNARARVSRLLGLVADSWRRRCR